MDTVSLSEDEHGEVRSSCHASSYG
eukprot:COSAG05_NODE_17384_length_326_cov_0.682819_1_plen_24_part_01